MNRPDARIHMIALALLRFNDAGDIRAFLDLLSDLTTQELRLVLCVQTTNLGQFFKPSFDLQRLLSESSFDHRHLPRDHFETLIMSWAKLDAEP